MSYSLRVLFGAKSPVGLFTVAALPFDLENANVWSYYFYKKTELAQAAFVFWSFYF
jgi:hypothetical protein